MSKLGRRAVIPRETLEQLYYDEGLTQQQIADRLGVGRKVVLRSMREYGFSTRTSHDYNRFSPSKEELVRLYEQERLSQRDIAAQLGVSKPLIAKWMALHAIPVRPADERRSREKSGYVDIPEAVLNCLYHEERLSLAEIGKLFGVTHHTIGQRMAEYGIPRRPPAERVVHPSTVDLTRDTLMRLYHEEGRSQQEIGKLFGVSGKTIGNRMKQYGISTQREQYSIPEDELAMLYYEKGMTQKEIGVHFGVSESTIGHRMVECGMPRRTSQDYIYFEIAKEDLERLYYEEQLSQAEIGQLYGVTGSTIGNKMTDYGLTARPARQIRANRRAVNHVEIPKETILELYYENRLTLEEVAQQVRVSVPTLRARMAEYGLEPRGHGDYVYIDIPRDDLLKLYVEQGMTAPAIAERYGCVVSVVYRRLAEHGIATRPGGWDKVKQIVPSERLAWSPSFAYVLGLLASDGNLRRDSNEVKFYAMDRELTDSYCRLLGLRPDDISPEQWGDSDAVQVHVYHDTRLAQYKPQFHVVFSDHLYRARLEAIGLMPNKSTLIGPLAVPDVYFRDFLRGEFDGDGCWCISRNNLFADISSGSPAFRRWLLDTIRRLATIKGGHLYNISVRFQGRAAEQLASFIYYAPELPCLSRKRAIGERWLQEHPRLL